ncbi:SET domain-containing protein [Tothia fuscella]|uniref:SET domain-containing protein n=1 Tax=Tothia fuscella TaxID=1048955 RepID=A0A9P4NZA3_9PEZI|nr:SET domain-containing protein [Tothia fuscella]
MNGTDPLTELEIPLFEIRDIPGKGKGLIARFDVSTGTQLETILVAKLKAMPKLSQRQFLSLHNNSPGKYPFSGIFKTNALPCGPGSPIGGVYPTAYFINHSCVPNAHNNWNNNKKHETIYAIRPIKIGSEITILYDHGGSSSVRQAFLKESFGFDCTCSGCTLPSSLLQTSDHRRTQMQSLDEAIGNSFRMISTPHESLRDCYLLLQVLNQEFKGSAGALLCQTLLRRFSNQRRTWGSSSGKYLCRESL